MKTLIIYPGSDVDTDSVFYLIDPSTGNCLDYHLCSNSGWAKQDLYNNVPEQIKEYEKIYGEPVEVKFINETTYNIDEIMK